MLQWGIVIVFGVVFASAVIFLTIAFAVVQAIRKEEKK